MKQEKSLIALLMIIFCIILTNSNVKAQLILDTLPRIYKIHKIHRVKNAFLIEVTTKDSDLFYTIVSLNKKIRGYKRIKKRKEYKMRIKAYSQIYYMPDLITTHQLYIDNQQIKIKPKWWTGNTYTTSNLIGLKFIKND